MKFISHRGNLNGIGLENNPTYIDSAILKGFDVEIDLRILGNNLYLGHDSPDYLVNFDWLVSRKEKLWIHCKDLKSVLALCNFENYKELRFFCHSEDPFVLVSSGHVWMHHDILDTLGSVVNEKCILPLITEDHVDKYFNKSVYGICSDFIEIVSSKNKF